MGSEKYRYWFALGAGVASQILQHAWPQAPAELYYLLLMACVVAMAYGIYGSFGPRSNEPRYVSPKELAAYLSETAEWGYRFKDKLEWFNNTTMAVRDELVSGRLRARGRMPGQHSDGSYWYPTDGIPTAFWKEGDLNWMIIINSDYRGDVDAYDPGYGEHPKTTYLNVTVAIDDAERIWPRKNWFYRLVWPAPICAFEKPEYSSAPWAREGKAEDDADVPRQAPKS